MLRCRWPPPPKEASSRFACPPSLAPSMGPDDPGGEPAVAAALELTFLSLDGVKASPAETKHYYAAAWLDPLLKQRARPAGDRPNYRQRLYFPLSRTTLVDVSSCVTVEVLCPSRLPFQPPRLVGSALLPISSIRVPAGRAGEAVSLSLRKPSGRVCGTILLSARISLAAASQGREKPLCCPPSLAHSTGPDDPGGEPAVAAALELTFLSLDGVKASPAETKHYYAAAWLDPRLKQRARPAGDRPNYRQRLYFPLSRTTLVDVSSCVTVEVLCPSRLPFHPPRLVGSALLPISSVRVPAGRTGEAVSLPLRKPSGRVCGTILLYARILWDIGFDSGSGWFPEPDLLDPTSKPGEEILPPSAPPLLKGGPFCDQGGVWLTLMGGAVATAAAILVGVACRRLNVPP